jgi:hypothetical protein
LLAIAILGGAVALQFMETGLPDSTLLMTGMAASAIVGLIGGISVAAWMIHSDRRRLFLLIPGVRIGRVRSDPKLPHNIVELNFTRPEYRSAFVDANPETCETRFESILASVRFKVESGEADREPCLSTVPGDHEYYAWRAVLGFGLMFGAGSLLVLWFMWLDDPLLKGVEHRGWLALLLIASALSCIGVILRIEAARVIAFATTLVLCSVLAFLFAGDIRHPPRKSRMEGFALGAFFLGMYVWALTAGPTRRLCSRWGRLSRLFARRST